MDDLIRDPMWTFIGAVLALIAVVVMVLIFVAQRKRKQLVYDILSNTQLLGVKEEIRGKVKVLYEGSEVKNVHLLTLRFTNTGNQPIASSDYEKPMTISFKDHAAVLTYEVMDEDPDNLGVEITEVNNVYTMSSVLLNPKDTYSVKLLVSDMGDLPCIDGRINGVKKIANHTEGQASFAVRSILSAILIAVGAIIGYIGRDVTLLNVTISSDLIGGVLFGLGYVIMVGAAMVNKRFRASMYRMMRVMVRGVDA